jgi:hypothetical protein
VRRRFSKAAIVIGLTVGFVTIGGGIALASSNGSAVQSGSQVTSNDRGNGGDDNGRGGDDHGRGGDDHGHGGDNHGGGGHH